MWTAHLTLAFLWIFFGVLHSVFASLAVKQRVAAAMPKQARHYRLAYTLFAFLTFAIVVWYQLNVRSPFLFRPQLFTKVIGGAVAFVGLLIMSICIKKYFISLSGLKSLFEERPTAQLMIGGIHRFVRHPLYLGTFLAIWGAALFYPVVSFFIANFFITAYTLLGISLEEKKLIAEFGTAYKTYQQTVPKLIPAFGRK